MDQTKQRGGAGGFTLVEILVAVVLLMLIMLVAGGMVETASDLWLKQRAKAEEFEGTNAAHEALTRSLAQATLNTHWGYKMNASFHPVAFRPESELHFVMGRSVALFGGNATQFPGMAVFFQAPEGRTASRDLRQLQLLLNEQGFFTRFGDAPDVPPILQSVLPPRYRFRLMEWRAPAEDLQVYGSTAGTDWFLNRSDDESVIAENIVALVLMAEYPEADGTSSRSFLYDSRDETAAQRLNQLPPKIRVLMLAISEVSARLLADKYGTAPPPLPPRDDLFVNPEEFETDITEWETDLRSVTPSVNYLFYNSIVHIQSAKWNR